MADYITRAEFEEAINALRCYGDQQTIDVQQTPGGQVITSNQVLTEEASDPEYISVSYDAVAEEFTVTVTNMPVNFIGSDGSYPNFGRLSPDLVSQTLVFDKPTANTTLALGVDRPMTSDVDDPTVLWYKSTGTITVTDADTIARQNDYLALPSSNSIICTVDLNTDGTYAINNDRTKSYPIQGYISPKPYLYVNTSTKKIILRNMFDPLSDSSADKEYVYSEPFTDTMILGWSNGDTSLTLDDFSSSGSYTHTVAVGIVYINASNQVYRMAFYDPASKVPNYPIYYTGSFVDNDGNTITIRNGMIINKTAPP